MVLTRAGRLMLASLGERTTLEDFMVALEMRPELDYTEQDAKIGLEALTEAGLLEPCGDDDDPEWQITQAGNDALHAPVDQIGSPATVAFEPHPGMAATEAHA